MEGSDVQIQHPNREKAGAKATKAGVVLLLVASAALILVVFFGGLALLQGAHIVVIGYVIVYLIMAFFVAARWSRGVLPLTAGLATVFIAMAAIAAPAWFARDKPGLAESAFPPGLLGLLVLVIIAVQVLLIIFAMRGFSQEWNVEIERTRGDDGTYRETEAAPAR